MKSESAKLQDSDLKFRDFVREEEILQSIMKKGELYKLDPLHIRKLFSEIIEYSVRVQEQKLYKTNKGEAREGGHEWPTMVAEALIVICRKNPLWEFSAFLYFSIFSVFSI